MPPIAQDENDMIQELHDRDVEAVSGGLIPYVLFVAAMAVGYQIGRDLANR